MSSYNYILFLYYNLLSCVSFVNSGGHIRSLKTGSVIQWKKMFNVENFRFMIGLQYVWKTTATYWFPNNRKRTYFPKERIFIGWKHDLVVVTSCENVLYQSTVKTSVSKSEACPLHEKYAMLHSCGKKV